MYEVWATSCSQCCARSGQGLHQTIRNIKQTLFCKILNICFVPLFVKLNLVKYSQFPCQTNFPFWVNCCPGKVLMRCWITITARWNKEIMFTFYFDSLWSASLLCDVAAGHRMHLEQWEINANSVHCKVWVTWSFDHITLEIPRHIEKHMDRIIKSEIQLTFFFSVKWCNN